MHWKQWILDNYYKPLPRSLWFRMDNLHVYLRVGKRAVGERIASMVTISNIESIPAGEGHFKSFILDLENHVREHKLVGVYVESVVNPEFATMLQTHGYNVVNADRSGSYLICADLVKLIE